MNLEETKTKSIKCIAAGAHFQPKFNWFLADSILNDVEISDSKENVEDGKVNFMSSLVYKGDHKDFNKTLKCEVDHKGHTDTHLEDENNIAKAVLNLRFDTLQYFFKVEKIQEDSLDSIPSTPVKIQIIGRKVYLR